MYVGVDSLSDTQFVHGRLFPGTARRHPGLGFRQCWAICLVIGSFPSAFAGWRAWSAPGVSLRG